MKRFTISAAVVAIALMQGVGSESVADEGYPKTSAPPTQQLQWAPQQIFSNPTKARVAVSQPVAKPHRRIEIKLSKPNVFVTIGAETIVDLDVGVSEIVTKNSQCLSVEAVSEKSLKLSGRQVGITQVKLRTAHHGEHILSVVVCGDFAKLSKQLDQCKIEYLNVKFSPGDGVIRLSGIVSRQEDINTLVRLAKEIAPKVINNFRLADESHKAKGSPILVRCHVLEFQASKGSTADALQKAWPKLSGKRIHVEDNLRIEHLITNLAKHGSVRILADPTVATLNGRQARFRIGYEVPVPVKQLKSIEYKHVGTTFEVTPALVGDDAVKLQLKFVLTSVDPARAGTQVGDIPHLSTLHVETTALLRFGQSFAMTGLPIQQGKVKLVSHDDKTPQPLKLMILIVKAERFDKLNQAVKAPSTPTATKPQATVRE